MSMELKEPLKIGKAITLIHQIVDPSPIGRWQNRPPVIKDDHTLLQFSFTLPGSGETNEIKLSCYWFAYGERSLTIRVSQSNHYQREAVDAFTFANLYLEVAKLACAIQTAMANYNFED